MYQGQEYPDGYEFVEEKDPCSVCSCYGGEVVCSRLPCYHHCRHPYTAPGQCCGECDRTPPSPSHALVRNAIVTKNNNDVCPTTGDNDNAK